MYEIVLTLSGGKVYGDANNVFDLYAFLQQHGVGQSDHNRQTIASYLWDNKPIVCSISTQEGEQGTIGIRA